jgi:hypothetical protein
VNIIAGAIGGHDTSTAAADAAVVADEQRRIGVIIAGRNYRRLVCRADRRVLRRLRRFQEHIRGDEAGDVDAGD